MSTPVGIALDIIKKEENGYIYNHQKDLVQIMDYLYLHQDVVKQIGLNNFQQRELFSWSKISKSYQNRVLRVNEDA